MKKYIYIIAFLSTCHVTIGQQIINIVKDKSAFAIRGKAIPAMLAFATARKNEQSGTIIPAIIWEEKLQFRKYSNVGNLIMKNLNALNALTVLSAGLILLIEAQTVLPTLYAPGFRETKRKYKRVKRRYKRLNMRVAKFLAVGTMFIDGDGYYRVAAQRLALEYLEVYSELSEINFKLAKVNFLVTLLPNIAKKIPKI
jgi:hypothetical protein